MDSLLKTLTDRIHAAAADRTPLSIRGGGSKDFYGESLQGELLDVAGYRGITSYEPSELVVTVRSGTPLAELEATLAAAAACGCTPCAFPTFTRRTAKAAHHGAVCSKARRCWHSLMMCTSTISMPMTWRAPAWRRGKPQRTTNANDDSQLKVGDYFDLATDLYQLPRPPRIARDTAQDAMPLILLSFMSESRRLDNTRLKRKLLVQLHYPTVAQGLADRPVN